MSKLIKLFSFFAMVGMLAGYSANVLADDGSPSEIVNKYHQAIMDKDIDTIEALSAPDADIGKVKAMLDFRAAGMKRGGLPKILKENIDGETASVVCKFGPTQQAVDLQKVEGNWRVK